MPFDLSLSPAGHLLAHLDAAGEDAADAWAKRVQRAFAVSQGAGLFALAAQRPPTALAPSPAFWRDYAARYLTELCRTPIPEGAAPEPLAPPAAPDMMACILGAPPMRGAEYLTPDGLETLWRDLDTWVRSAIEAQGEGLAGFLAKAAPMWHQVGRVCFHLAENKRDAAYPFAFLATYAPRLSASGKVHYVPLNRALEEYAGARNRPQLVKLLSPVSRASQKSALIKNLSETGDVFHPLAWTPAEAYRFLQEVPALEECGILVRLPDWWRARPRPRVAVTIGQSASQQFAGGGVLDFDVRLALGDEPLDEAQWRQLMEGDDGLVLLKGQWVEVDREKLAQALAHWKKVGQAAAGGGISFAAGMRLLAGAPADLAPAADREDRGWSFVNAGAWLGDLLAKLRDPERLASAVPNGALSATLRPYQETGVRWLWFLANLGLGACLADDMGLGKTLQVLALLLALKQEKGPPSLVVLPASLLANWKAELERFAPALAACYLHASEMPQDAIARMAADPARALAGIDAVFTTYGMLTRQPFLLDIEWRLAVIDEAQAIKNPGSGQTRTVKKLKARARIALTGTPVENRIADLWSIFDFLCPGLLGAAARFKTFVKSLEERAQDRYAPLRNLVGPYILRRRKTDRKVIADLPDKTEVTAYCGLVPAQAALYARSVKELRQALQKLDGMARRGLVLAYLLRFKQICNHPSQLLGDGAYAPGHSGKFARLAALAEEIASRQEKALVFTQFKEIIPPLASFLAGIFGREGLVLHGGTAVKNRRALVEEFQREDGPPFFVVSLKAGGTGLNLTAATHVIHFDRWWNPAVENQATDRAFRIGQTRNVLVHKFVCRGTVEERIDALIADKRRLADDVVEAGAERMLTEMNDRELLDFVSLDVEKAGV